ncbi:MULTISPECIES: TerC family protein [Zoogloea]|uniref:TerC family protein n=1 Tax=Zoogloea oleivorans TaxID=1552750 RepID=A0A6C2CL46_9RHOO|nr:MULTISPECIES: TerC family protein [Zoogloea]MDD2669287.1 TerC family protein [Zoogloea sp.]TYC54741.1 TerC family protein [Zoogloea oleivorans]
MSEFLTPVFWVGLLQIIAIDLVLSGDNAVVIALACRRLQPEQRKIGIFWGVAGAVSLRVVLTAFAASLLGYPWLKLIGGLLLLWIGVKLLLPDGEGEHEINPATSVAGAVKTIIVADFVMSVDNVIGVAGAAGDSLVLLGIGLAVSIPVIVWSSQVIMKSMERFPVIVTLGAGLLGWVAGGMIVGDPLLRVWMMAQPGWMRPAVGVLGVGLVLGLARLLGRRAVAGSGRQIL